ncbi:MAG TPA: hypothetical protein VK497_01520 [Candidatus Saccharimonadales bacterium]|nr:hypothetical protein [Candidatus Saccharimonadales bacterium]
MSEVYNNTSHVEAFEHYEGSPEDGAQGREKPINVGESLARFAAVADSLDGNSERTVTQATPNRVDSQQSNEDDSSSNAQPETPEQLAARIRRTLGGTRRRVPRSYDIHPSSKTGGRGHGQNKTHEQLVQEMDEGNSPS